MKENAQIRHVPEATCKCESRQPKHASPSPCRKPGLPDPRVYESTGREVPVAETPCPSSGVPRHPGTPHVLPQRKRKSVSPGQPRPSGQLLRWGTFSPALSLPGCPEEMLENSRPMQCK